MGYDSGYYYGTRARKKKWRYLGVPIPYRLQWTYEL